MAGSGTLGNGTTPATGAKLFQYKHRRPYRAARRAAILTPHPNNHPKVDLASLHGGSSSLGARTRTDQTGGMGAALAREKEARREGTDLLDRRTRANNTLRLSHSISQRGHEVRLHSPVWHCRSAAWPSKRWREGRRGWRMGPSPGSALYDVGEGVESDDGG